MRNTLILLATALLLSSCSTSSPQHPENLTPIPLPAETSFNPDAGRGGQLLLTLHLEDGQPLLFSVDTGCPVTLLDRSLSPKLGKPLGKTKLDFAFQKSHDAEIYSSPKLFLGNTQLRTGTQAFAADLAGKSSGKIAGILGMDCLRHYCVQLDFRENKLRFLDSNALDTNHLSAALPLVIREYTSHTFRDGALAFVDSNLFEKQNVRFWIDTGFYGEGDILLESKLFRNVLRDHKPSQTGQFDAKGHVTGMMIRLPELEFAGNTYTNAVLAEIPGRWSFQGWLSLKFLARHLVTLDFPKSVMYLKQTSAGPLAGEGGK